MNGDHLKLGVTSRQPVMHHSLEQWFALLGLVLAVQLDVQLFNQFDGLFFPEVHDGVEHLEVGAQDELTEGVGQFLLVSTIGQLAELAVSWVKVPVSPRLLHHILYFFGQLGWPQLALTLGCKLGHIHLFELLQSECPAMQGRTKAYCAQDGGQS